VRFCIGMILLFGVSQGTNAAGLPDRFYVHGETGIVRRQLDGPLRSQPQVFPGSAVVFRNGSSSDKWYGAVRVGVKVNEFFALEAGYQDFGSTSVRMIAPPNVVFITAPPENFRSRDRAFTIDPVFTWKIGARTKLRGFWGVAFNRSDVTMENYVPVPAIGGAGQTKNSRSTQSRLGIGAGVQLTPRWDVNGGVDYQRFFSFARDGWLAHAGLGFTF